MVCPPPLLPKSEPCDTRAPAGFLISQDPGDRFPPVMKIFPFDKTTAPAPSRGSKSEPVARKFPLTSRISQALVAPIVPQLQLNIVSDGSFGSGSCRPI